MLRPVFLWSALLACASAAVSLPHGVALSAQSDLDAFMRQVMERRDDNWKRLQQYILDEREEFDLRGPGRFPLWGERRDFTWFIQDGFFVRSPLKVNGAAVGEEDRRKYEDNYLRRQKTRDRRERERAAAGQTPAGDPPSPTLSADEPPEADPLAAPTDVESFIRQTRQPEFISTAYFLRFKFDEGRYALVGREQLEGRDVLRVEYYPRKLFSDDEEQERRRRRQREASGSGQKSNPAVDNTVNRLMNSGSRVTLWVEPTERQIIKYTFDNVDMDFFPGQWLVNITGGHATMTMSQPFPDVWLPRDLQIQVGFMMAIGEIDARFAQSFHDYRQADITSTVRVPGAR